MYISISRVRAPCCCLRKTALLPPATIGGVLRSLLVRKTEPYAATSESSSFPNLGYEIDRYLGPGEIVRLHADRVEQMRKPNEGMQICSFLWVYYGFPTSCYEGKNVEEVRFSSGLKMGQTDTSEVDCTCGIPDSGVGMALGYAEGKRRSLSSGHFEIHAYMASQPLLPAGRSCAHWWRR